MLCLQYGLLLQLFSLPLCRVLASRIRMLIPLSRQQKGPCHIAPALEEPGLLVCGRAEGAVPVATAPSRLLGSFLSSSKTSDCAANDTVIPECCIWGGIKNLKQI